MFISDRRLRLSDCALLLVLLTVSAARAEDKGIVIAGNARFTVITPNLIRIEYDPAGKFVDDRSLFAVNRDARYADSKVTTTEGQNVTTIDTGAIRLSYIRDNEPLSPSNLKATIKKGDATVEWRPGAPNPGNLGGTLRTLDGVSGAVDVGQGILSRDGWFLLDDSRTPLLTNDWVRSRPKDAGTDWYFFGYGTDYRAALKSLTMISGPVPMPRKYMLGAWYSRYWNYTADDYKQIVNEYAEHDFPLDVIVMDMDWHVTDVPGVKRAHAGQVWTGYTWDKKLIPDPAELLKWFHDQGLHVTLNDHPADGVQPHEEMYDPFMRDMRPATAAQSDGRAATTAPGGIPPTSPTTLPFDAGDKHYLDTFWHHTHQPHLTMGVDFWWLDWQQYPFTRSIPDLTNLFWLNTYYYDRTTSNDLRGASFSRWAGFGDHRHPIHFSGDAHTNWPTLAFEVPFTSTAGNVGCFFWSHDIGGHMGGRNEESYARWCQFGALSAALRSHSTRDKTMDRRPWTYPKWAEDSMRKSFHLRSELFPYIYSSAAQACRDSVPMIRPMYIDYPNDENAYQNPQQYLFGDNLLVAPITSPGIGEQRVAKQVVWFPPGNDWYNFFTGERYEGGTEQLVACDIDTFPLFARGGSVIPMQPYSARMATAKLETLVLRAFPGRDDMTRTTTLYEDDGTSPAYRRGTFATTEITHTRHGGDHVVEVKPTTGHFDGQPAKRAYVVLLGDDKVDAEPKEITRGWTFWLLGQPTPPARSGRSENVGFFDKIESPTGFPSTGKRYLYVPPDSVRGGTTTWELVADLSGGQVVVLTSLQAPSAAKSAVPDFAPQAPPSAKTPLSVRVKMSAPDAALDATIGMSILDRTFNAARDATATASSAERDYSAAGAIDGVADGYPNGKQYEWASDRQKEGATITLEWKEPQRVDTILLYDRPNKDDQVTKGAIAFDDGTGLDVGELPNDGKTPVELKFPAKTIRSMAFRVTGVSDTTQNAGISEIAVLRAAK